MTLFWMLTVLLTSQISYNDFITVQIYDISCINIDGILVNCINKRKYVYSSSSGSKRSNFFN